MEHTGKQIKFLENTLAECESRGLTNFAKYTREYLKK